MACRFPGAPDLDAYWDLLREGRHGVREASALDAWSRERAAGLRHAALLDDIAGFDAPFFRISPREAVSMDPQQRLLMELAWHALEDAGFEPSKLRGRQAGVYVGISGSGYALQSAISEAPREAAQLTGSLCSIAANRLSYFLGIHGPSMAIDTACSSSLVALDLALRGLEAGDTEVALVGGVSLILDSFISSTLTEAGVLSQDGRCKTFDERADGYVRGEGAGVLVLRPLAEAERDGDRIYAVLRGGAVNQDGPSNGLMAPNRVAQEMLLERAYRRAGIAPSEIDYVEAHGTGTLLGDPIEAKALGHILGRGRSGDRPCRIGTSKTNIGHLEAAAGVAGVIKCCLMLHHASLVPSLNFERCNPYIALERLQLAVQTRYEPWPARDGETRRAGVSSFGIGGTNAHVVLESVLHAPPSNETFSALHPLLVVSAASSQALRDLRGAYARLLAEPEYADPARLTALCRAAATLREPLPHRAAFTAESVEGLRRALTDTGDAVGTTRAAGRARVAFLFTGQGSQYPGMAAELFRNEPLFRRTVERCAALLDGELERPLLEVMFEADAAILNETIYSQPAIFAVEVGLAEVWKSWGITPSAVLGHSVGELAAGCVAGVLGLEDAARLVALRGRMMQESPADGAMLAAAIAEDDARALLEDRGNRELELELAAVNGPRQTVFTGRAEAIEQLAGTLEERGISATPLQVSRAFHSQLLDLGLPAFARSIRDFAFESPTLPFFSGVTGAKAAGEVAQASYWVRQARSTVRFADAVSALVAEGCDALLEVGPTPILLTLARSGAASEIRGLASLRAGAPDGRQMVAALGGLFELGAAPNWAGYFGSARRSVRSLPRYPFQHRDYWLGGGESRVDRLRAPAAAPASEAVEDSKTDRVGDAETLVRARLAAITGHAPGEFSLEARLVDLGLSSIDRVELNAALTQALPGLQGRDEGWSQVDTLADVVDLIDRVGIDARAIREIDPASEPPNESSGAEGSAMEIVLVPQPASFRREPGNRVLESVHNRDGRLEARIVVDQEHPFYFDHPYDHVPGVLFVEAVQQMCEWMGAAVGGEELRRRLYLRRLGMRFERWGDLDDRLSIAVERLVRLDQDDRAWSFRGEIFGASRCARFDGVFGSARPEDEAGDRPGAPGVARSGSSDHPTGSPLVSALMADQKIVHKHRPENVLITEPSFSDPGVVAAALPPRPGHALGDGGREYASVTQIAEWTRQFLTARAEALDRESPDERFILLSLYIRLNAGIVADHALSLWSPVLQAVETASLRLGGSRVELRQGDRMLGEVDLFGGSADAEEYEQVRWGNRS